MSWRSNDDTDTRMMPKPILAPLRWRHNELDSVSNHQPHDCLLNRLFRRRSMKTSKLRVTDLCAGNSPGTGEFSAQMASNAENVSIWWRHHVTIISCIIGIVFDPVVFLIHWSRPKLLQMTFSKAFVSIKLSCLIQISLKLFPRVQLTMTRCMELVCFLLC